MRELGAVGVRGHCRCGRERTFGGRGDYHALRSLARYGRLDDFSSTIWTDLVDIVTKETLADCVGLAAGGMAGHVSRTGGLSVGRRTRARITSLVGGARPQGLGIGEVGCLQSVCVFRRIAVPALTTAHKLSATAIAGFVTVVTVRAVGWFDG